MEFEEFIELRMREALSSGKFVGCQDILSLYKEERLPPRLLPTFVDFLEGWGDALVGSNEKAALVKYELAQQALRRVSPTGAGDVAWGNDLSQSLLKKIGQASKQGTRT